MGLAMTLIRNGFLTLNLPELTAERLKRAGLLISVAPSEAFSRSERRIIREFVEKGGIFICTVGYPESGPSRPLLADFGFYVGGAKAGDGVAADQPIPLGHFKSPYLKSGDYMAHVRFYAGWPIECTAPDAKPIAYGPKNSTLIIERRVGDGAVVVVGDTGFAMNKNLEREGGEPFDGMRENADFWRWLLPRLRNQPPWIPTQPIIEAPTTKSKVPYRKSPGRIKEKP
jgi:hypothetical protein